MEENIVALILDYDKTLARGNMQHYIFEALGYSEEQFWTGKDVLVATERIKGKQIEDTMAYIAHTILMAQPGQPLDGLTQKLMEDLGEEIRNYHIGVPDFIPQLMEEVEMYGIAKNVKFEVHVVSAGFRDMLMTSKISDVADSIYACEFFYDDYGRPIAPLQVITPAEKTKVIFEISKGVGYVPGINVNTPVKDLRVPLNNMVFVMDGETDIAGSKIIRNGGGKVFGVYNPHDANADKVMQLLDDKRVDGIFSAEYTRTSPLYTAIKSRFMEIVDNI